MIVMSGQRKGAAPVFPAGRGLLPPPGRGTGALNQAGPAWAGYAHFFSGRFAEDTGAGGDADWLYLQLTLRL